MDRIVCPNCGAEYLPQEIFILTPFNEKHVHKDADGKLLFDPTYDTYESYKCDYCNKTFQATMAMAFTTTMKTAEEYVTKLHKPTLFLKED